MIRTAVPLTVTLADLDDAVRRTVEAERTRGWIYVSLLHGEIDDDEQARLNDVRKIVHADQLNVAGQPTCAAYRGGNDWSTWCLRGPLAGLAQAAIVRRIEEVAPSWWRWSTDPMPPHAGQRALFGPLL